MPVPSFIVELRKHVGTAPLWLSGATAVILDGRRVLLVRRADSGDWSPVSGIIEPGEEPGVSARREALEEAGVHVRVDSLAEVNVTDTYTYPNGDIAQYLNFTFRCTYLSGDAAVGDDESLEVAWFDLDDLPDLRADYRARIAIAIAGDVKTRFVR
ncbi:NUDIX hydrolase [Planctomonas psychrotolerans]|uniref:NUDIX hydrolase n=1 Tax=Planctomonas psychrotolerans TaxID=2528712 RepID=UPI00123C3DF8|nr:NUDIX domain-containing protein [Planctomonas psychrotolerans]